MRVQVRPDDLGTLRQQAFAMASPMPEAAPVTTAVLPANRSLKAIICILPPGVKGLATLPWFRARVSMGTLHGSIGRDQGRRPRSGMGGDRGRGSWRAAARAVWRACGGDLAGLEWEVLYPAETLSVLPDDPSPDEVGPLDAWRRFHIARLLEQIPGAPAPPGRVAIEAYQRVPLLRALDMVRPRLLLADGVGLGKTIQAGLIAAELLVRRRAHRILIVCPPGPLLRQWEQEMRVRFGLRFTAIADAAGLAEPPARHGTRRQSVRRDGAVPDLDGLRQAGPGACGTGTRRLGSGHHRRGASLRRRGKSAPPSGRGAGAPSPTGCCC